MDDTGKCPKCGFAREPERLECPACGIVYARYRPDRPRTPERLFGGEPAAAGADPGSEPGLYNPYQAPSASVVDRPGSSEVLELADRGTRLVSRLVDGFIFAGAVLLGFVPAMVAAQSEDKTLMIVGFAVGGVAVLALMGYNLYLLALSGQTIARRWLKIRIVRLSGEPASLGRLILLRYLAPQGIGLVPLLGALFSLANILFIFREDRRCIHDHFADTVVVKV